MVGRALDTSFDAEVRASIGLVTLARLGANSVYRYAPPFLAVIAADLDVSLTTLGAIIGISELVGVAGPAIGALADRLPRRTAMIVGLGGVAAGAATIGVGAHGRFGVIALAVGLLVASAAKILFDVSLVGWIAERVPYAQRGRAIGLTETSWAGGLLVGVPIMGLVTAAASWRWGYTAAALCVVLLAVAVRSRLPVRPVRPEDTAVDPARGSGADRRTATVLRRLGAGWFLVVAMGTMLGSSQAIFVVFGSWLEREHGFGVIGLSAIVVVLGGVELAASMATASRSDRLGKPVAMAVGLALMIPSAALLGIAGSVLPLGIVALVLFIGGFEFAIVSSIPMSTELVSGAPAAGLGISIGAGTIGRAGLAVPATAGFERFGLHVPGALAALLAAVSLGSILVYRHRRPEA
jgi:MFS transporter, DHA1 family, inner membrane transport protein